MPPAEARRPLKRLWLRHDAVPMGAILVAAMAARVLLLTASQLDYDEGVYWQSLRSLAAGHTLYREVYSSQPPGFLLLVEPGFLLGGHTLLAARASVAVVSLALVVGAWLATRRLGVPIALAAATLAAFDPLLLRGSVTLQADVPAMALAVLAFGLFVEASARAGRAATAIAGVAGALAVAAVLVKFLAAPLAIGVLAMLIAGRRWRLLTAAAAGGVLAAAVILLPFASELAQLWQQSVLLHLTGRAVSVESLTDWPPTTAVELVLLVLSAIGLILASRAATRAILLGWTGWLLPGVLFLVLQRPLYPHHLVAVVAPAVMPAGVAFRRLGRAIAPVLALIAIAGVLTVVAALPSTPPISVERFAAAVPPGRAVVTDDQFLAAAAGLDTPPWLVDTSHLRIESGELSASRLMAEAQRSHVGAIVFATGRLVEAPGFSDWVARTFPNRQDLGSGVIVYTRWSVASHTGSAKLTRASSGHPDAGSTSAECDIAEVSKWDSGGIR